MAATIAMRVCQPPTKQRKLSVSTVLDPSIERTVLKPLVTSWGLAQKQSSDTEATKIAKKIHASLSQELTTRWNLVRQAAQDLRNDQRLPNSGLVALRSESAKQFYINWGEKALSELRRARTILAECIY